MAKFIKVAIPQTISSALEDWQIQIIALFASRLDEADLAAFSSSITIILVCHTLSIGLADAAAVRVGNRLGANDPRSAKYISWVAIVVGSLIGVLVGGLLAVFGKYLGRERCCEMLPFSTSFSQNARVFSSFSMCFEHV